MAALHFCLRFAEKKLMSETSSVADGEALAAAAKKGENRKTNGRISSTGTFESLLQELAFSFCSSILVVTT